MHTVLSCFLPETETHDSRFRVLSCDDGARTEGDDHQRDTNAFEHTPQPRLFLALRVDANVALKVKGHEFVLAAETH